MSKREDFPRSYRFTAEDMDALAYVARVRGLSQAAAIRTLIYEERDRLTSDDLRSQVAQLRADVAEIKDRLSDA